MGVAMKVEQKLEALGLTLPPAPAAPPGLTIPFSWARVHGGHVYLSGHAPQNPDGSGAGPFGKVGAEVTPEQAHASARLATLALLGSLKRAIGDLDRVTAWLHVTGMVNVAPGFNRTSAVVNGGSDLILQLFGPQVGAHARAAPGMAALPFDSPVIISAVVAFE